MCEESLSGEDAGFAPTVFDNPGYDEMVVMRDIPFYSVCEHHMLPFFGVAHAGYVPSEKVIGLSKIVGLVRAKAAGLQIQEPEARARWAKEYRTLQAKGLKALGTLEPRSAGEAARLLDIGIKGERLQREEEQAAQMPQTLRDLIVLLREDGD
jgi:hypothetical protein